MSWDLPDTTGGWAAVAILLLSGLLAWIKAKSRRTGDKEAKVERKKKKLLDIVYGGDPGGLFNRRRR